MKIFNWITRSSLIRKILFWRLRVGLWRPCAMTPRIQTFPICIQLNLYKSYATHYWDRYSFPVSALELVTDVLPVVLWILWWVERCCNAALWQVTMANCRSWKFLWSISFLLFGDHYYLYYLFCKYTDFTFLLWATRQYDTHHQEQ